MKIIKNLFIVIFCTMSCIKMNGMPQESKKTDEQLIQEYIQHAKCQSRIQKFACCVAMAGTTIGYGTLIHAIGKNLDIPKNPNVIVPLGALVTTTLKNKKVQSNLQSAAIVALLTPSIKFMNMADWALSPILCGNPVTLPQSAQLEASLRILRDKNW